MSGFSKAERDAMKQRAEELRAQKGVKGAAKRQKEFDACLAAIDELTGLDNEIAARLHVIATEEAPHLDAKTWYGFPSYAKDGNVVIFYQPASKFGSRYGAIGFNDNAELDDGAFWPTAFAVVEWTDEVEATMRELVRRAAGTGA